MGRNEAACNVPVTERYDLGVRISWPPTFVAQFRLMTAGCQCSPHDNFRRYSASFSEMEKSSIIYAFLVYSNRQLLRDLGGPTDDRQIKF
jgi:hypothetical protein